MGEECPNGVLYDEISAVKEKNSIYELFWCENEGGKKSETT
jgi:hypothetical protein